MHQQNHCEGWDRQGPQDGLRPIPNKDQDPRKTRQVLRPHYTVAGVEDGSFEAFRRGSGDAEQHTIHCLTVLRGNVIQDVRLRRVKVDGLDATEALLDMLSGLEIDAVILGGVTFAGFNVVDVERVNRETSVPVIVFSAERPDAEATLGALRKHFGDWRERWSLYEDLGEIH